MLMYILKQYLQSEIQLQSYDLPTLQEIFLHMLKNNLYTTSHFKIVIIQQFQQFMRAAYINFSRIFDFQFIDYRSDRLVKSLQIVSNLQLLQLLQLRNQNYFKYNEISQVIQFAAISENIDIFVNNSIIYVLLIFHVILIFLMTYYSVRTRLSTQTHIQYTILIYCSILEFPIISIMIKFINHEDFQQKLIVCLAVINLFVHFVIQILQQILGRSFSIDLDNKYFPLQQVVLNQFIRFYKVFTICIAYIFDNQLVNLALLTIYQFLQAYQQFKFISVNSFNVVQICCTQMICFIIYFNISIVWSLILIMLSYGISTQCHQYIYHKLIGNQSATDLNIAYVCSQLTQQNNCNFIEQYFIFQNHKCIKCKDMSDISVCILKKLKLSKEQDRRTNLIYCDKISKLFPIKALIYLTKCSNDLRIDYEIRYTCKIQDLVNQINKRQRIHEQKDLANTLTVSQIRQSVKLQQQTIKQFIKNIKEQIKFWENALQGFQSHLQYLVQMKKLAKVMIENKNKLKQLMEKQNFNIIELKIFQFHYAIVYLSQKNIYSYQKQIDEKLMIDRYKQDKNVNNKVLFEGRYILVQTSLVFNRGQLINFNSSNYNQFFNLPINQLNQLKCIEDLMPQFKRSTHNKFIDNYIRKGYSSFDKNGLNIFICNPEGYIIMANLQLNYDNSIMNDVILTGLIAKEQNINKAILISTDGQILGMDQGSFELIYRSFKADVGITELVKRGYFIQAFIKNIQKSMDTLNQIVSSQNECQLMNITDQWQSENYYSNYMQKNTQINQNEIINKDSNYKVNQNYSEFNLGNNLFYNLYFIKHFHKDGEMCYFKIMIIDQEYDYQKKGISNQSKSKNSQQSLSRSDEASNSCEGIRDNCISIQISQLNQKYKFFSLLQSQDKQLDLVNEDFSNQNEIHDVILTSRQQNQQFVKQVKDQNFYQQNRFLKENHVEPSMTSQRSSQDSLYLTLINNLYSNNKMVKQLVKISYVLTLTFIYTIIIIFVNHSQIENSVNNQLNQIELLRKPQNISYVYTSLSIQLLFKYANQKGIIELSPFMVYWNQVQQIYMQKYIESLIVPLNIEVPIIASSFMDNVIVEHIFIQDQQYEIEVSLSQFYNQIVQQFCLLRDDDKFQENIITLMNKGYLRENIIKLLNLNDRLLKQINKIVTNLQQSEINTFMLSIIIEILALMVIYNIQHRWWKQIDKIMTELVLIIHRAKVSQIQQQIQNLRQIEEILLKEDFSWIQSPISNIILNSEDKEDTEKGQSNQQLISIMPQDYYINKLNLIICISILIINIMFNVTGYLIYYEQNTIFQRSLSTISNYVQFLHDVDSSILYGGMVKLDGPLNGDQTYIDQEEIIKALQNTSNQLLPQLNILQQMIYSSQLQDNVMFQQLLFENLCETSSKQLVMCDLNQISQEYWEKDQYNYLIYNGIIGYTNQFIKYITENYQYEFSTLSYNNIQSAKQTINQPIFQNFFLQYYLDMQETLRIFLKTFHEQNTRMGQDIIQLLQGYYIIFGIIFLFINGVSYYYWIKYNQYQIYLSLQIIGIIPHSQVISQNFKSQVLKLYKDIY
ncbi:hypothetical protein pb186bvf_004965 [Paramecium bursaria]